MSRHSLTSASKSTISRSCGQVRCARNLNLRKQAVRSGNKWDFRYIFELERQFSWILLSQKVCPDLNVASNALKACGIFRDLEIGRVIHADVTRNGDELNRHLVSNLINMYAKCGSMVDSQHVFDSISCHTVASWTSLILGYAQNGREELALGLFARMKSTGCSPDHLSFVAALKACAGLATKEQSSHPSESLVKRDSLEKGMAIHAEAVTSSCDSHIMVANTLVEMYAKCGSLEHAQKVFDSMAHRSVFSWNSLILGYAENGAGDTALDLFARMGSEGYAPNALSYAAALKGCINMAGKEEAEQVDGKVIKRQTLDKGRAIHAEAVSRRTEIDHIVCNMLMEMYGKCGSMTEARNVFSEMKSPGVVSWTVLMQGYSENDEAAVTLELFSRMKSMAVAPNSRTFLVTLKACANLAIKEEGKLINGKLVKLVSLEKGMEIHAEAASNNCELDSYVTNMLVDMYAKCGSLLDSRRVFDRMIQHTVVSWNSLLMAYADNGEADLAVSLFSWMRVDGIWPNALSFVAVLKACTCLALQEQGKQIDGKTVKVRSLEKGMVIHSEADKSGYYSDIYVINTLIDMYAKCGSILEAKRVFDKAECRTVVSWNTLILGYVENREDNSALDIFTAMLTGSCAPSSRTFIGAFKACAGLASKEQEKQIGGTMFKLDALEKAYLIHAEASKRGFDSDLFVAGTLMDTYAKCGSMLDARRVFDKMTYHCTVSWTALILGYAEAGEGDLALQLVLCMRQEGCAQDALTFIAALKACFDLATKEEAKQIAGKLVKVKALDKVKAVHSQAERSGCKSDVYLASTLVDIYSKCGSLEDARKVFDTMSCPDVVSRTALVYAYAENGEAEVALEIFSRMQADNCPPNALSYIGALKACETLVALEAAKSIHGEVCASGLEEIAILANALVDVYGKCGSMVHAQHCFDSAVEQDGSTWNALLAGYCRQGDTSRAFPLFSAMQKQDAVRPTGITFLCLLTACSHRGLVEKGKEYFKAMSCRYGIEPGIEHYHCVIDILGRANQLEEAMSMVRTMPYRPNVVTWRTILGACRKWKNVDCGRAAFDSLLSLEDRDVAGYTLMTNLYGSVGMWEQQLEVENMRSKVQALRKPGMSWWSDGSGVLHTFVAGDRSHPQNELILVKLRQLVMKMKEEGYVNISEADKEDSLCGHSEKLAIACALINTAPGTLIQMAKNLRICDDCHAATVMITRIEQRTIICRDAARFHVFKDGVCSCGDYW